MMLKNKKKIVLILGTLLSLSLIVDVFAATTYDKLGRPVEETTKPTAAKEVDPDQISIARGRSTSDASKNIVSDGIIIEEESPLTLEGSNAYTVIRHSVSINHADDVQYEVVNDPDKERIMLLIKTGDGMFYAKDGFYEVNGKLFYFDDTGHMVLGPARDTTGREYFFSYETGEMLLGDLIQK